MDATRIFVNPDMEETSILIEGLAIVGNLPTPLITLIGPRPRPSFEEDFLGSNFKKSIDEIGSLSDDGVFVVCAVITSLADGEGWWYGACLCHRAVAFDTGVLYCKGCDKHVFVCSPRYRVKVNVSDGSTCASFVMYDDDIQYLIEKQCSTLFYEYEVNSVYVSSFPVDVAKELEILETSEDLKFVEELLLNAHNDIVDEERICDAIADGSPFVSIDYD
ncbi:hypothetical protein TSUD_242390 [Trifolium subterraneum]|uniref:Replication factor A C-terminal domain-containing protein n=1 Tax=Trifolium subterraneum TaxID=3900 RepID=A0A2Z6P3Z3_TRISU|nr:hypothetical protein TSUD_242390 [Trifolium subterraneum]